MTYIYVTYEMANKSKEVETKDSEKRSSFKIRISISFVRETKVIITEFSKAHSFLAVEMRNNSNFWDDLRVLT